MTHQLFHAGDLVYIADDLGEMRSHFYKGLRGVVTGSYRDLYESHGGWGAGDDQKYNLYLEHHGGAAWYDERDLTLIERGRFDLWEQWRNARRAEIEARMNSRQA